MNKREWELILVIAREKSISKAAEKLYMTQPALSLFLTRLENSLGTKLFIRSAGGLIPTYAGERYISTAEKILKLCDDFDAELCDINRLHKGRLRVGATVHLGSYVFPLMLPLYKKRYPNIEILITEGNSTVLEKALAHNELDLALMHIPFLALEAQYEVIAQDPYVAVIARDSPLEQYIYERDGRSWLDPVHLKNEKFVLSYPAQRVRQITDRVLELAGIVPDISFMTSSVETALRVSSVGMGVTLMPESYIQLFTCPVTPHFCHLEEKYQAYWTFVAAWPKEAELSGPAREFIRILKENYDPAPPGGGNG